MDNSLFERLEREIEMPPGTVVAYMGPNVGLRQCMWVVEGDIDETRVMLRRVTNRHVVLNAFRSDLVVQHGC